MTMHTMKMMVIVEPPMVPVINPESDGTPMLSGSVFGVCEGLVVQLILLSALVTSHLPVPVPAVVSFSWSFSWFSRVLLECRWGR